MVALRLSDRDELAIKLYKAMLHAQLIKSQDSFVTEEWCRNTMQFALQQADFFFDEMEKKRQRDAEPN